MTSSVFIPAFAGYEQRVRESFARQGAMRLIGARMADVCKVVVYLTDIRHRGPVYRVLGERMRGVFPVFTGVVVVALARPEWLVEVDVTAVIQREAG